MAEKKQTIVQTVALYGKQLLGFIRGKVNSDEDAEDILQDVWYQYSNLDEVDAIESVSGWLYRVAKNKITDRFRRKKPERLEDFAFENESGEINFKEILLADPQNSEDEFFKKIFWEELMSALEELPEKQRSVFIQNELEEKSLQEIADQSGESIKTIISRKGYAVKFLRERLNDLYNEFLDY
ncbi:RNA polymerase subunit sigma-24 [Sphingobacteriaceae bacterium]|nr:RNA polymerase subunit sigma-24 [Sphingobacteriaceae bacterium]